MIQQMMIQRMMITNLKITFILKNFLSIYHENVYFIFKQDLYVIDVTDDIILKFRNMIVKTHSTRTPESQKLWNDIKFMAQNDIERIYDKYLEFYNEIV